MLKDQHMAKFSFCHMLTWATIGAQLVRNHSLQYNTLRLQKLGQDPLGSLGIAACLHDLVKHITGLVNGGPFHKNDNTTLQQHFLDKVQAQQKPIIQPHSIADDLRWETMALIADWRSIHTRNSIAAATHKSLQ